MVCPDCGYMMSDFDKECPRCHGKGIAKPDTQPAASLESKTDTTSQQAPTVSPSSQNATTAQANGQSAGKGCCGCLAALLIFGFIGLLVDDKKSSDTSSSTQTEQSASRKAVENSAWDGSVRQVKKYLERNLNDADSVRYVEWSPVRDLRGSGSPYAYMVRCKYRAKNGFGAYILAEQLFYMDEQGEVAKVTHWK